MSSSAARYFPRILNNPSDSAHSDVEAVATSHEAMPIHPDVATRIIASPSEATDEALLSLVSQGSREALAVLFRRYARIVRGVAYRVLRDPSEADDLLQDVFLFIHRLSGSFDSSKGSAKCWILQMTYRRALCRRRYLTTRHFYNRLDLDEVAEEVPDPRSKTGWPDDTLEGALGSSKAKQMFAILSEDQRQTLRLYFVDGYTLNEIAHRTGQSLGNVKHHYFRGLEKLRKQLLGSELGTETAV